MFATLTYSANDDNPLRVQRTHETGTGQYVGPSHSACENCRSKKLKCDGGKPICERCETKSLNCKYPSSLERRRRRMTNANDTSGTRDSASQTQRAEKRDQRQLQSQPTQPQPQPPAQSQSQSQSQSQQPQPQPQLQPRPQPQQSHPQPPTPQDYEHSDHDPIYIDPTLCEDAALDFDSFGAVEAAGYPKSPGFGLSETQQVSLNISKPESNTPTVDATLDSILYDGPPGMTWGSPTNSTKSVIDFDTFLSSVENSQSFLSPGDREIQIDSCPSAFRPDNASFSQGREGSMLGYGSQISDQALSNCSSGGACRCLVRASVILEQLEAREHDKGSHLIDSFLSFQKQILAQCHTFLDCRRCRSSSASLMVPLLICDKLIDSFQMVSSGGISPGEISSQSPPQGGGKLGNMNLLPSSPPLKGYLGAYEVEGSQEWEHVLSSLIILQFRRVGLLVERFKALAVSAGWQMQLTMLRALEERLQDQFIKSRRRYGPFVVP